MDLAIAFLLLGATVFSTLIAYLSEKRMIAALAAVLFVCFGLGLAMDGVSYQSGSSENVTVSSGLGLVNLSSWAADGNFSGVSQSSVIVNSSESRVSAFSYSVWQDNYSSGLGLVFLFFGVGMAMFVALSKGDE